MSTRQSDRYTSGRPILKGLMSDSARLPRIIQGGMGVAVSNWKLARAVSKAGHLGVVSGTALDVVLVRRLQDGDPGGHVRRAMESFPMPEVVAYVMKRFFEPEGLQRPHFHLAEALAAELRLAAERLLQIGRASCRERV